MTLRDFARDRVAWAIGVPTLLVHLAVAERYDTFRDELYFIVCGRHPAFGYADQPPLVPLIAAASQLLGDHTWMLRVLPALAAALVVWLTVGIVRAFGGGAAAAVIAGLAVATSPMLAGITATLNTTSFEPLAWTIVAYALVRALRYDDRRALIAGGIAAGIALEAKYAIALWLVALAAGALLTNARVVLARRELWLGLGLALVIALPSVVWQTLHGWPFAELMRAAAGKNADTGAIGFTVNQIIVNGPLWAPVWMVGVIAPFVWTMLRPARFLSIAFVATLLLTIAGHGKDYYLGPAYPSVLAIGAVGFETALRARVAGIAYGALATAATLVFLPFALPVLPPPQLAAYVVGVRSTLHLTHQAQENADAAAPPVVPETFADMLEWRNFEHQVAAVWRALPDDRRAGATFLTGNYGEAAALDVYGPADGLPAASSGHNQYYLWGPHGDGRTIVVVRGAGDVDDLPRVCRAFHIAARIDTPWARSFENRRIIGVCADPHPTLRDLWSRNKNFS